MSFSVNNVCCNSLWLSAHNMNNWDVCRKTSNMIIQSYWVKNSAMPHLKLNHKFSWNHHPHFTLHSINNGDTTSFNIAKHNNPCRSFVLESDIVVRKVVACPMGDGSSIAHGVSDSQNYSAEPEGSTERNDDQQEKSLSTTKILEQLKRYGASGVLSYGLLNTAYYLTTFLLVWTQTGYWWLNWFLSCNIPALLFLVLGKVFYFAPAPGKMGYLAAVSRFLKVMAMVWAGSQVTKLIRAAGALALAPLVDRGLSWFTVRYKFESRGKAFFTVVAFCLSLAGIMFLTVTLLSA